MSWRSSVVAVSAFLASLSYQQRSLDDDSLQLRSLI